MCLAIDCYFYLSFVFVNIDGDILSFVLIASNQLRGNIVDSKQIAQCYCRCVPQTLTQVEIVEMVRHDSQVLLNRTCTIQHRFSRKRSLVRNNIIRRPLFIFTRGITIHAITASLLTSCCLKRQKKDEPLQNRVHNGHQTNSNNKNTIFIHPRYFK